MAHGLTQCTMPHRGIHSHHTTQIEMRGKGFKVRQIADSWDPYNLFYRNLGAGGAARTPAAKAASKKGGAGRASTSVKRKPAARSSAKSGRRKVRHNAASSDDEV